MLALDLRALTAVGHSPPLHTCRVTIVPVRTRRSQQSDSCCTAGGLVGPTGTRTSPSTRSGALPLFCCVSLHLLTHHPPSSSTLLLTTYAPPPSSTSFSLHMPPLPSILPLTSLSQHCLKFHCTHVHGALTSESRFIPSGPTLGRKSPSTLRGSATTPCGSWWLPLLASASKSTVSLQ